MSVIAVGQRALLSSLSLSLSLREAQRLLSVEKVDDQDQTRAHTLARSRSLSAGHKAKAEAEVIFTDHINCRLLSSPLRAGMCELEKEKREREKVSVFLEIVQPDTTHHTQNEAEDHIHTQYRR